ncbi:MAG: glycosyltransferase [Clostridiales bacterium]|nr:glycosyltransferase [Clostridiales bacterium]
MDITILAPAYNEEAIIDRFINQVASVLEKNYNTWEVLIVNDGSTDATEARVKAFMDVYPEHITCITHPVNQGLGAGLETGFKYAKGNVIVTMDADCTQDANLIPQLTNEISNDTGVVIASRYVKGGGMKNVPPHRLLYSKLGNLFFRILFGLPSRDISSGFRAYRKDLVKRLSCLSPGFEVQVDILRRVKQLTKIKEYPFVLVDRTVGVSKMRYGKLLKAYFKLFTKKNEHN